ncbi:hypothetical protein EDB83DRAFT_2353481 [Lactarius deliciosus]|nr:hypothetical protein EDB83DRAFT_2353481 [Lactarius deliciosus]
MHLSHRRVDIVSIKHFISICFTRPGAPTRLKSASILSVITQIWDQLSPLLSPIEGLGIYTTQCSNGQDDMNKEQWLELIRGFGGAKDFRVTGGLATDILHTLRRADGEHTTMLPSLRTLGVLGPMRGSLWEAVEAFTSRRPSDHFIEVYPLSPLDFPGPDTKKEKQGTAPQQYSCTVCNARLHNPARPQQQQTQRHAPKMCPYYGVFNWSQPRKYNHSKTPRRQRSEVAHTDALISNPTLQSPPSSVLAVSVPGTMICAPTSTTVTSHGLDFDNRRFLTLA